MRIGGLHKKYWKHICYDILGTFFLLCVFAQIGLLHAWKGVYVARGMSTHRVIYKLQAVRQHPLHAIYGYQYSLYAVSAYTTPSCCAPFLSYQYIAYTVNKT
jgi:hypothetical protein